MWMQQCQQWNNNSDFPYILSNMPLVPLAKLCQSQKITLLDQLHFSKKILFIEISQMIRRIIYSIIYNPREIEKWPETRLCNAAIMENI